MKRFFVLCTCLALVAPITLGCQEKTKTSKTTSTETPSGSTTVQDSSTTKSTDGNK